MGDGPDSPVRYVAVGFDDLPAWRADDHATAVATLISAGTIADNDAASARAAPRAFLERTYVPHKVVHSGPAGLLTGYYEPVLRGSRVRSDAFPVPLYLQPDDLAKVHGDDARGHRNDELVAGRMVDGVLHPYFTRGEIETGALDGRGLEFMFLADPIDAFFLHVQGSGQVVLEDGVRVSVGFAAKNGLPYTSIGRILIDQGEIPEEEMSLERLRHWLEAHPKQAADVMRENKSFIFFQEHASDGVLAHGPVGSLGVTLTPGRSLAVDTSFHELGVPIYVSAPELTHDGGSGFHRLMVAQDVGSAIRGPERGDIFWGTGEEAGRLAGETVHAGSFFVFFPRNRAENAPS